ncbi:phosphoribosylanthranilate isomerase [Marinobacter caseinilyticus]|uniref:phosphoribosylanthranilate isomerase n=1 Tax=Marinobacter caseinilyticus TaxID=2692195 RepID=UPI00140A1EDF|nr:phosphoribosylanthranilate isomerase [Marinobacter caseinilyticus]
MSIRTKICGITRESDAIAAVEAGVDAIGFVFYEPSPRAVSTEVAAQIARKVPAFVNIVGLFVNPTKTFVDQVLADVPLDTLQFHGDEPAEFCHQFGRRWIKAIRVQQQSQIDDAFKTYQRASGLLLDAYDPDRFGGTGHRFDWHLIPAIRPVPLILAGGLDSDNVARAIEQVRPWAVDVSGGVEREKGIKDPARMKNFLREVHRVDKTD